MSLNLTMLACWLARSFNNQINLDILQIYGIKIISHQVSWDLYLIFFHFITFISHLTTMGFNSKGILQIIPARHNHIIGILVALSSSWLVALPTNNKILKRFSFHKICKLFTLCCINIDCIKYIILKLITYKKKNNWMIIC